MGFSVYLNVQLKFYNLPFLKKETRNEITKIVEEIYVNRLTSKR